MQLSVRPMIAADVAGYVDYLKTMSKADSDRVGLAVDKLPSAEELTEIMLASLAVAQSEAKSFILVWCVDDVTVGHSSLKDIVPYDRGGIHLHMWRDDLRGKGIGPRLFCMAALDFYDRFGLKSMICEPRAANPMPNRMLQKIGFPLVQTYVGASSELSVVTELNRYAVLPEIAVRYLFEAGAMAQTGRYRVSKSR